LENPLKIPYETHWKLRPVMLLLSLFSLTVALSACTSHEPAAVTDPVRPAYVATTRSSADAALSFVGEVRAARRAELSFVVAGLVSHIAVEVGDLVRQGQVLASLDDKPLLAQLAGASAEVQRTQAQLAEARRRVERMRPAQQADAASPTEWGAVQVELNAAEAAAQAAQAQRVQAVWSLEQSRLRSPIDGVVGQRTLERGQATGPGVPVLNIDGGGRELVIHVPGNLQFKPGESVTLHGVDATLKSRVLRSAARLDAGGVRQVWLAVPDAAQVGSTWSVAVRGQALGNTGTGLQVPLRAVMPGSAANTGSALRLAADGQTLKAATLTLGAVQEEWIEVQQGLQPGDRVVVAGAQALRPGMKVQPIVAKP
jgi:RND family efflux transporter MFP subunit